MLKLCLIALLLSTAVLAQKTYESEGMKFSYEVLLQRKDVIWGFDFLPDGRIILTERGGKMLLHDPQSKSTQELKGLPEIYVAGQGGLLDVRVHPNFKDTGLIYFSFSHPVGGKSTTALGIATLKGFQLQDYKQLFAADAPTSDDIHYGGRIEFDREKKHLFLTIGDRDERPKVQDLKYHIGSIVRLRLDGSVPEDNPFADRTGARKEIWSYGHRSPQGLQLHPERDELWEAEMGPRGGDEVNLIKKGANYGWPLVTKGREYYGPRIGEKSKPGMEEPVVYWVPSISPSAIAFYSGDKLPAWKHDLFLANLSGQHLRRLRLDGTTVVKQEELLKDLDWRFRSARSGPDGLLYLGTDEGRLLRLTPAN